MRSDTQPIAMALVDRGKDSCGTTLPQTPDSFHRRRSRANLKLDAPDRTAWGGRAEAAWPVQRIQRRHTVMTNGAPAVVLLSGGVDSSTVLAIAKGDGFVPYAISFKYGQRHLIELERARAVAKALGVAQHTIVEFDLRAFGGSALTS